MEQLPNPDREVDARRTMGIVVRLMLRAGTDNEIYLTYEHADDFFMSDIAPENAAHAFQHPNLYREGDAPTRGNIYAAPGA